MEEVQIERKYKSVSVPLALVENIESVLREHPEQGYSSVAEFVKDACREKIEKIKRGDNDV